MTENNGSISHLSLRGPPGTVGNLVGTLNNMSGRRELEILYAQQRDVESDESSYMAFLSLVDGADLVFDRGLVVEQFARIDGAKYRLKGYSVGGETFWKAAKYITDLAKSRGLDFSGERRDKMVGMIIDYNFAISGDVRKVIGIRGDITNYVEDSGFKIEEEEILPLIS